MIEDTDSPTFAFFDFNFSEFTDSNFDISNDIIPAVTMDSSASVVSASSASSSSTIDSQKFCSSDYGMLINNRPESTSSSVKDSLLWSSIEELAQKMVYNNRNTLSCLDKFIKEPESDLVELVQCNDADYLFFKNLIADSNTPQSPIMTNCRDNYLLPTKSQYKEKPQIATYSYADNTFEQRRVDDPLESLNRFEKELIFDNTRLYSQPDSSVTFQLTNAPARQTQSSIKKKNTMYQQNPLSYCPIPDAGYPPPPAPYINNLNLTASTIKQTPQYYHHRKSPTTVPSLREGVVHHHPYHPRYSHSPNLNHVTSRAMQQRQVMYSSELTKAQILEIQAISKAQQDFIRARERQEAEKNMMFKHHSKK
ncbi:hypothetical protein BD560DRAFT_406843 [Blakeslea trispora]|nr:hypothetical protein BD560DRAFT_406843 [Blakeslea trispora]